MKSTRSRYLRRLAAILMVGGVALTVVPPAGAASAQVTDAEDDAYRIPRTPAGQPEPRPPMPLLSNDAADILAAKYETAPPQPGDQGAYKVSVTVPGQPNGAYNYIVGAQFGEDCWIFHDLTVGETRRALTLCGSKAAATIPGSRVVITGKSISATFSFRRFLLPGQLKRDPVLGPLYVLTCPVKEKEWACAEDSTLDFAYSEATFPI